MKKALSIFAAASLSVSTFAIAPHASAAEISGVGAMTCAQLDEAGNTSSNSDAQALVAGIFSWTQGCWAGKNLETPVEQRRDVGVTQDYLANGIIDYCTRAPQAYLWQVAEVMFNELPYIGAGNPFS